MGFGSFAKRGLEGLATFDAPLAAASSTPAPMLRARRLRRLAAVTGIVGTTQTQVQLLKNGAPIAAVTIAANQPSGTTEVNPPVQYLAGDTWQVQVPVAGAGADRLGVAAEWT